MPTDPNTVRTYNAYAQKWAEKIRIGNNIAHEFLEKPAMYANLPDVRGKRVLCVGCGTGEECQYLKLRGAKEVVGIDIAKKLLEVASASFPHIKFKTMDMEKLKFPRETFDLTYSSLTLHYVKSWIPVLRNVRKVLKQNGTFLFSTIHPVKWGARTERTKEKSMFTLGYEKYKNRDACTIYGDYLNTRKIKDRWFNELSVAYYHKPLSLMWEEINKSGFEILDFLEPKPIAKVKKIKNNFWRIHQKIPIFVIFKLRKK